MIHVAVSACVLGDNVRFDGGHKRSAFVDVHLSKHFKLMPICPEVGMGMPVPRPPIRVTQSGDAHKLTDSRDVQIDHTEKLNDFYQGQVSKISKIDGYIFAAKSPTCGIERIKVYDEQGGLIHRKGMGLFVQHLVKDFPHLPIEEDGRLNDQGLRESFITRVYVHQHFRHDVQQREEYKARDLVEFHSKHKLLVMAYSPQMYRELGRLVARSGSHHHLPTLFNEYLGLLMKALSKPTNRKKHTNVLMHIQGYFKKVLDKQDKQELSLQIDKYRRGYLPLMAPVALLQHHLNHFPNDYLSQQVYLQPYPEELGLRA